MPIPWAKASLKVRVSKEGREWVEPQLDDGYFPRYVTATASSRRNHRYLQG